MRAIQIIEFGGPDVLLPATLPEPVVPTGHVGIAVDRAGVNYADTHQAENTYLQPATLPLVPGAEVVGRADDGRRVVALVQGGGYAERAVAPNALTYELPDAVGDGEALALVLQGTTAWHLLRTCAHLAKRESVVVHAGAGGVGSIAVQLARLWGAGRVIATASTPEKRALAVQLGADIAIDPTADGLRDRILDANGGESVDVVLEMTGGRVTDESLATLAPFGRLVFFGAAARELPRPVDPVALMAASRAVVGFWLAHCFTRPHLLAVAMEELLALTATSELRPVVGGEYPLSEARRAHEDLRARATVGKLVLDPTC